MGAKKKIINMENDGLTVKSEFLIENVAQKDLLLIDGTTKADEPVFKKMDEERKKVVYNPHNAKPFINDGTRPSYLNYMPQIPAENFQIYNLKNINVVIDSKSENTVKYSTSNNSSFIDCKAKLK